MMQFNPNPYEHATMPEVPIYTQRQLDAAVKAERELLATLQTMLREVGEWGFRRRSVAEEYDVVHGAGSWRRALRA